MTGNPTLVEVDFSDPRGKTRDWQQGWLISRSSRHAWVQFTTRGEAKRVPVSRVREIEEER